MSELETQCWICPYCFDDHATHAECRQEHLKESIGYLKAERDEKEKLLQDSVKLLKSRDAEIGELKAENTKTCMELSHLKIHGNCEHCEPIYGCCQTATGCGCYGWPTSFKATDKCFEGCSTRLRAERNELKERVVHLEEQCNMWGRDAKQSHYEAKELKAKLAVSVDALNVASKGLPQGTRLEIVTEALKSIKQGE